MIPVDRCSTPYTTDAKLFKDRCQCCFSNITFLHLRWNIIKCNYFRQFSWFEMCAVSQMHFWSLKYKLFEEFLTFTHLWGAWFWTAVWGYYHWVIPRQLTKSPRTSRIQYCWVFLWHPKKVESSLWWRKLWACHQNFFAPLRFPLCSTSRCTWTLSVWT